MIPIGIMAASLHPNTSPYTGLEFTGGVTPSASAGLVNDGPIVLGLEFWVTHPAALQTIRWYRDGLISTPGILNAGLYEVGSNTLLASTSGPAESCESTPAHSSQYAASKAFDGNSGTYWLGLTSTPPQWIRAILSETAVVTSYTIRGHPTNGIYSPQDWQFQGSNDGTTWTTLDAKTGQTLGTTEHTYSFDNTTAYAQVRLLISANAGGANYVGVATLSFAGAPSATAWDSIPLSYTLIPNQHYRAVLHYPTSRPDGNTWSATTDLVSGPLVISRALGGTYSEGAWPVNPTLRDGLHANYGIDVSIIAT